MMRRLTPLVLAAFVFPGCSLSLAFDPFCAHVTLIDVRNGEWTQQCGTNTMHAKQTPASPEALRTLERVAEAAARGAVQAALARSPATATALPLRSMRDGAMQQLRQPAAAKPTLPAPSVSPGSAAAP
jgi:hypothetical protein